MHEKVDIKLNKVFNLTDEKDFQLKKNYGKEKNN